MADPALIEAALVATEATIDKCLVQLVATVAKNAKYPSSQPEANQSIAVTVSKPWAMAKTEDQAITEAMTDPAIPHPRTHNS